MEPDSRLSLLQMFLAFCLLGVRRHDGAQECAISFPFPSLLVWGSQKWEGTRDSLAKWVGECVIIAFFFLSTGSDFLAGAAGRARSGDICREYACLCFLFPKLPLRQLLVCKDCFQSSIWMEAESLSYLPLQDLAAGWLSSCCTIARAESWWARRWRAVFCSFWASGPVPSCFQPVISSLEQGKLDFCLHAKQFLPVPAAWIPPLSHKGKMLLTASCVQQCHVFPAKISLGSRSSLQQRFLGPHELGNCSELPHRG